MDIEDIKKQIDTFFSDTSRSKSETKDGLGELSDHCQMLSDTIQDDDE
jgi:hypothetical protein